MLLNKIFAFIFMRDFNIYFSFLFFFFWYYFCLIWYQGNIGLIEQIGKWFLCFHFLEEIV